MEEGVEVAGGIESETGTGSYMHRSDSPSRVARQLVTSTWYTYLAQFDQTRPQRDICSSRLTGMSRLSELTVVNGDDGRSYRDTFALFGRGMGCCSCQTSVDGEVAVIERIMGEEMATGYVKG